MMKLIRVLIEQTGVETVVSPEYYERYQNEGVRFLDSFEIGPPEKDVIDKMNYKELKEECVSKGLEFRGNASSKELRELLRSN